MSAHAIYSLPDEWQPEVVKSRYLSLCALFGVAQPIDLYYRRDPGWDSSVMEDVVDGVTSGDLACIQLGVDYLVADVMVSYSGYIRARLARRLKHVALLPSQQHQLVDLFLDLLRSGSRRHEWRDYLRLWASLARPRGEDVVEELARVDDEVVAKHAERVLRALAA